ncbi:MAG: HNH endonuclease [Desulfobulbaceae bacterium]|nr:HNH endonuclease [Desulfobulbaceae bacterium]
MDRDFLDFDAPDDREIRAERAKAKALRKTRWWQQKTAPGLCYYCQKKVTFKQITMDHLVPLARGGRSTKDNLVPCCKECNNLKKSMMPIEWEAYRDKGKS